MGNDLQKGTTFVANGEVTPTTLNNLVDEGTIKSTFVTAKTLKDPAALTDQFVIVDGSTFKKVTTQQIQDLLFLASNGTALIGSKAEKLVLVDADQFLINDAGTLKRVPRSALSATLPAGTVLQVLTDSYATNTSISSSIPIDDTIPQSGEGTQILSVAITPQYATSLITCEFNGYGATATGGYHIVAALFRNTTCINAIVTETANGISGAEFIGLKSADLPNTTSPVTYTVRIGTDNTVRMNGYTSGRKFGGASECTLVVTEIKQ